MVSVRLRRRFSSMDNHEGVGAVKLIWLAGLSVSDQRQELMIASRKAELLGE
jgi:hypothetical protein